MFTNPYREKCVNILEKLLPRRAVQDSTLLQAYATFHMMKEVTLSGANYAEIYRAVSRKSVPYLYALLEPIGHIGIIDPPRFNSFLILVPITFVTIEELLAVTFIFNDLITFKSILVPVIILLTIALPFLRCVNCHFCLPFFFRSLCAYCLCNKFTVIIPLVKWLSVQNRWCYFAPIEFVRLGVHRRSEQRLRRRSAGQQTRLLLRSQNQ